jgi:adhesin transport system membrane fusion protein
VRPKETSDDAWFAERNIHLSREAKLTQSLRVIADQVAQKEAEISENINRRRGYAAELDLARQQLKIVQNLVQTASASQMELLDARARSERLTSQLSEADNSLPRLQAALREAKSREREIRAQAEQEARATLSDAVSERDRLTQEEKVQTDRLSRTVVRSPISGTVNRIMIQTVGGVVKPGDTLMEITPLQSEVLIEAQVTPNDRAELAIGLPVIVRIGAYEYSLYGSLKGFVTEISADTVSNERGERQFRLRVSIPADERKKFGRPISPGMSATVDVVFGQRTVLQYLIRPLRTAVNQALVDRK